MDRMRRAKSWHKHSLHAQCHDDKFMFLWIAFNAAYGLALLDPNVHAGSAKKEWEEANGFLAKTHQQRHESNDSRHPSRSVSARPWRAMVHSR